MEEGAADYNKDNSIKQTKEKPIHFTHIIIELGGQRWTNTV